MVIIEIKSDSIIGGLTIFLIAKNFSRINYKHFFGNIKKVLPYKSASLIPPVATYTVYLAKWVLRLQQKILDRNRQLWRLQYKHNLLSVINKMP